MLLFFDGPFSAEEDIAQTTDDRQDDLGHNPGRPFLVRREFVRVQVPDGPDVGDDGQNQERKRVDELVRGMLANMASPVLDDEKSQGHAAKGDDLGHADGAEIAAIVGPEEFDDKA